MHSNICAYCALNPSLANYCTVLSCNVMQCIKGLKIKTRPPETLKCPKSKMWRHRKLKLNQSVYLMR